MDKRGNSDKKLNPDRPQFCQECLHREHMLHNEQQRLLDLSNENKKLIKQLRASISLNHQYQDENQKLKHHLTQLNTRIHEYQMNFEALKQKMVSEKKFKPKEDMEIDHLKRLRHEVHVYNQFIAAKRKEEDEKQIDYLTHQNWMQKK
jgi:hypothetical protein